ncbi:MAG: methyltransferase domain-containing protein [Pseudomonadales bacterium]
MSAIEQEAATTRKSDEMDWDAYARSYDEMCALNPAYQQNIEMLIRRLPQWNLPDDARVCDLGAGTGNYILQLSEHLPNASFWHVDADARMIDIANGKYHAAGLSRVTTLHRTAEETTFPEQSFDLIICINALYAFPDRGGVLRHAHGWLRNNGRLFIIDFGRRQSTLDWTFYLFRESIKANRVGRYARALIEAREVIKQNIKTSKGQESGRYWLHSTEAFKQSLSEAGFNVLEASRCYRNYADMAVCVKA